MAHRPKVCVAWWEREQNEGASQRATHSLIIQFNSPSKIRPMERVEYREQACLHFVEAMPIAAGRAGRGALKLVIDCGCLASD